VSELEFSVFRIEVLDIGRVNSSYARTSVPEQFGEGVNFSSLPLIPKMLKKLVSLYSWDSLVTGRWRQTNLLLVKYSIDCFVTEIPVAQPL